MSERKTIIRISEPVWKWLQSQKEIGESFDTLLKRVLGIQFGSKNESVVKEEEKAG